MTDHSWTPDDWLEDEISGEVGDVSDTRVYDHSNDNDPDPAAWFEWSESDRAEAVGEAHRFDLRDAGGHPEPEGGWQPHVAVHCIIENQLAADNPPAARETLARLRAAGIRRHDAVHALCSVVTDHIQAALTEHRQEVDPAALERDFRALDPDAWRSG